MSAIIANRVYKDISKYPKNLEEFIAYIKKNTIYYYDGAPREYSHHSPMCIYWIQGNVHSKDLIFHPDKVSSMYFNTLYLYKKPTRTS